MNVWFVMFILIFFLILCFVIYALMLFMSYIFIYVFLANLEEITRIQLSEKKYLYIYPNSSYKI